MWCIPPQQNAAFVAAMEDVPEVYSRPYDSQYPVVCMDEQPMELHHTPKYGFWLDIAEIELSAFTIGYFNRRIGTIEELKQESTA